MRVALIAAAAVDVLIAALVAALPAVLFGSGPEISSPGSTANATSAAFVAFCILAPAVGFAMQNFGRPVGGILIAWLPPVAALC